MKNGIGTKVCLSVLCAAGLSGSLFAQTELDGMEDVSLAVNMFSNQRAANVGDLLTVLIQESTASSKSETMSTSKTADAAADAPFFGEPFSESSTNLLKQFHNILVRTNDMMPISGPNSNGEIYRVKGNSTFSGKGSANSSESLQMTFGVRVVDKLPNGVLVIRGERSVRIKNETLNMVLTGLVRVRDINSGNQIQSNRVADAHIFYENDGIVTQGTRPGFVWRIFQFLNPL